MKTILDKAIDVLSRTRHHSFGRVLHRVLQAEDEAKRAPIRYTNERRTKG